MSDAEPAPPSAPDELTAPEQQLALKGSLALADGSESTAALWLTSSGLWLVDSAHDRPELRICVLDEQPLRYQSKLLGDRLQIGEHDFGIPTGSGGQAQNMLALARLRRRQAEREPQDGKLASCAFADKRETLAHSWLAGWLDADERVLAWLDTSSLVELASALADSAKIELSWLMTCRRSMLVAIGPLGDVHEQPLPQQPLRVAEGMGRCTVELAEVSFSSTLTNATDYRALAEAAGMARRERLREVARVAWRKSRGKGELAHWSRALLRVGAGEGDCWAALTLAQLSERGEPDDARLDAPMAEPNGAAALASWADGWGLDDATQLTLVERLRAAGHRQGAAALHAHWWERAHAAEKQPLRQAELTLALVDDLLAVGERARAAELLEQALAALPSPDVLELVPHVESAAQGGPLHTRLRLLDAMVEALGDPNIPHLPTLVAIAQLFPLSRERVQALVDAAEGDLKQRAQALLACLDAGGLDPQSHDSSVDWSAGMLSARQIEEVLRHPAARSDGALGRLQALLAQVEVPDHSALKSYCQRLQGTAEPAAHAALQRSVAALGSQPLGAYISRGDKSVGVRAFEGKDPFLLIGGDHLDRASSYHLASRELAFSIATEVAHVRYGHARVTSSDLWRGALEKGKSTLDVALGVMPALKAFKFGSRIAALAQHLHGAPVGAVLRTAARLWPRNPDDPVDPSVGSGHEQLLAAHRVTQFTADRAGLLIAEELAASFRAMFLTWPAYREELPTVRARGLGALLAQRTQEGSLRFAELAARIGALAAFYLSEDYATLHHALASRIAGRD